jgi:N-methylhydantoinase A
MIRIGIDIGGTFTDFVVYEPSDGQIRTFKLLSTPGDPSKVVIDGINQIVERYASIKQPFTCIHGSTVATNALLERKGARTALITTSGFKDILLIGRQNRTELYNFSVEAPKPLIPQDQCYEVNERIDAKGNVLTPLDTQSLVEILSKMQEQKIESVAVSLLFSFLNSEHEDIIFNELSGHGFHLSISSKVLPEFREYERTSTTAVNAYVSPILEDYLTQLALTLEDINLRVMQSNGGMISINEARNNGVQCILSGPAGGVIGADFIIKEIELKTNRDLTGNGNSVKIITFDMGGTSTDVSLIDGTPSLKNDSIIDSYPIRIPMLDIHTIGAGGGSIAYKDLGGALRVGPDSAGADPGPACYGKSNLPTVTDAHMVLGRIMPDLFLGGNMPLDRSRSIRAITSLANELGMDINRTALGIIDIANAHMTRALQVISVERGYDPREFTLVAFGGAGGLHAGELAQMVGIQRIIISPFASTLSALGMIAANVVKDYVQTIMLPGDTSFELIAEEYKSLILRIQKEFAAEGLHESEIQIQRTLDMRYKGQSYELNVLFDPHFIESFENNHQTLYGYSNPNLLIEIVNIRVRAQATSPKPKIFTQDLTSSSPVHALSGDRRVIFPDEEILIPIYRGEKLRFGNHITGPALVVRSDTTILLNPGDECEIDEFLNMVIIPNKSSY